MVSLFAVRFEAREWDERCNFVNHTYNCCFPRPLRLRQKIKNNTYRTKTCTLCSAPCLRAVLLEQLQHHPIGHSGVGPVLHHSHLWFTVQHLCRAGGRRIPFHRRLRRRFSKRRRRGVGILRYPSQGDVCAKLRPI